MGCPGWGVKAKSDADRKDVELNHGRRPTPLHFVSEFSSNSLPNSLLGIRGGALPLGTRSVLSNPPAKCSFPILQDMDLVQRSE
jgi:hypothetical protein